MEAHRTSHSGAGRVSPDVQDERHAVVKNIGLRGRQTGSDLRLLLRDFLGGPVAKTPCSQCRGPRFDPW